MLNLNDTLYFASHHVNTEQTKQVWDRVFKSVPWEGQWYLKLADKISPQRLISRNGEWTIPWPQELMPKYQMPIYDPNFSKTFEEVTDQMAQKIKGRVQEGEQFAVFFSGGIDSTLIVSSLIKNLSKEEMNSITVLCSAESMVENPNFYRNFIFNKIKTLDSKIYKYDTLLTMGLTPITGDEGDCIFGTLIGLNMYNNFDTLLESVSAEVRNNVKNLKTRISDPDVHYSTFKELIIQYLNLPWHKEFGRILYDKYDHNIKTASVPVHSLHDFFWWLIFNVKYLNCSVRGGIYYNDTIDCKTMLDKTVNWFNDEDYQRWSMVNNNNGQKIKTSILSYKTAAKEYIYQLDKNEWYRNFKTKVESFWNITNVQSLADIPDAKRPVNRIAIKKDDWELIHISDPGVVEYFTHHVSKYKIDWTDIK